MKNRVFAASLLPILMLNSVPLAANGHSQPDGLADGFAKFQSIDNSMFAAELKRLAPEGDVTEALPAQSNYFIERFREATTGQFATGVEVSRDQQKKRGENALKKPLAPRVLGRAIAVQTASNFKELGERP